MPILNDWIQDAIRTSLSSYVSPQYITIDLAAILNRQAVEKECISSHRWLASSRTSFVFFSFFHSPVTGLLFTLLAHISRVSDTELVSRLQILEPLFPKQFLLRQLPTDLDHTNLLLKLYGLILRLRMVIKMDGNLKKF